MNAITIRKEINLNTIVVIVGFMGSFAGFVTLWNGMQYKQDDFQRWIEAHDKLHDAISKQLVGFADVDARRDKELIDIHFRLGQMEKAEDNINSRLDRITESYGNQFTDIRAALNSITTQLALTNQSLQRLEAATKPPLEPKVGNQI